MPRKTSAFVKGTNTRDLYRSQPADENAPPYHHISVSNGETNNFKTSNIADQMWSHFQRESRRAGNSWFHAVNKMNDFLIPKLGLDLDFSLISFLGKTLIFWFGQAYVSLVKVAEQ